MILVALVARVDLEEEHLQSPGLHAIKVKHYQSENEVRLTQPINQLTSQKHTKKTIIRRHAEKKRSIMSTSYLKPRRKFCSSKILGEVSSFQLSSMERRPESSLKDQCQTTQAKKHHQKVLLKAEPAGFPLKISQVSKNSNIKETLKCHSIIFNPSFCCI